MRFLLLVIITTLSAGSAIPLKAEYWYESDPALVDREVLLYAVKAGYVVKGRELAALRVKREFFVTTC